MVTPLLALPPLPPCWSPCCPLPWLVPRGCQACCGLLLRALESCASRSCFVQEPAAEGVLKGSGVASQERLEAVGQVLQGGRGRPRRRQEARLVPQVIP
eukprot:COSAG04_NODE_10933_length_742_cov_3.186625_2_plen_98_part_01